MWRLRLLPHARWVLAVICLSAFALAACGPAATPTPTPAPPTDAPTEIPTEAETEAPPEEATDVATEASDDATEAADTGDESDATESAGEEGTAEVNPGDGFPGTISVSDTRVRSAPSLTGDVITELAFGAPVLVLGQTPNAGYVYVRMEDGSEGWIAKQNVQLEVRFVDVEVPVIEP